MNTQKLVKVCLAILIPLGILAMVTQCTRPDLMTPMAFAEYEKAVQKENQIYEEWVTKQEKADEQKRLAEEAQKEADLVKTSKLEPVACERLEAEAILASAKLLDAKLNEIAVAPTEESRLKQKQVIGCDKTLVTNIIEWNGVTGRADVIEKFKLADTDYFAATGKHITVYSSYRTTEEQREIRKKFGYTDDAQPSGSNGLPKASPPGMSTHEKGLALDIGASKEVKPYLEKYGFVNNVSGDPDHFELYQDVDGLTKQACESKSKNPTECTKIMLAIFQADSGKCTTGIGAITLNCGNMRPGDNQTKWDSSVNWVVYTNSNGDYRAYSSLQDGINDNVALYVGKYEGKGWDYLLKWAGGSQNWLNNVQKIYNKQ